MAQLRGVILDIDGTLLDSNDAHAHAWVETLAKYGHRVPFEKVRPLIGMGGDKLLPQVSGLQDSSPEGQRIAEERTRLFREHYLSGLKPFPATRELLLKLRNHNLKLAVASSAKEEELKGLLKAAGADDLIEDEEKTSSDDAENSKPDPDIVKAALKESGLQTEQVVMLGDTPYDIEAATKAGVRVVAFRCGGWRDRDLQGALLIYDGPADMLEHFDEFMAKVQA